MLLTPKAAAQALKRKRQLKDIQKGFTLDEVLFPEQLAFVNDPAPNKVAVCSRRAGKTVSCAAHLIDTAINHPEVVCLYITLSRNNAKKIIWREIKKFNKEYQLGGVPNTSELSISFPNGSIVYLSGAKDTNEIEKFRGLAIKLCYIDEAQSFRQYIKDLIDDVLSPALMDYSGTLCLIGTPGPIPTGYFHDCWSKNSTWSKHAWTFWDNPFIIAKSKKTHQEMLDRELKRRGVTREDPSIQREWFGKWVLDSNSLLLQYSAQVNHFDELPKKLGAPYHYLLGIDLGFNDADALAVLAYSDHDPTTYLVEEGVIAKQGLTELVEQINLLRAKYKFVKMVIDEGGLGKKLAEEMRRRHQLPVEAADKVRKMENVAFLNDALRTGRFKARQNSKFAQDSYLVEIDRDKSTPDKIKVSDRYHSDIIDAALYAFKCSPAYSYEPPEAPPVHGSEKWAKKQTDAMFQAALDHYGELEDIQREKDESGFDY